jgi:hypothetical protein
MSGWQNKLHQFFITIEPSIANTGQWRLIVALGILVIGLFLFEIMFRSVSRRIQAFLEQKGRDPVAWNISAVLPAARLAATAWLLRVAESLVEVSEQLSRLLHAVQALMMALAVITVIFWLIDKLHNLRQALPADLQERFPMKKWRVKVWKISAAGHRSDVWPTSPSPMIRRRTRSKRP